MTTESGTMMRGLLSCHSRTIDLFEIMRWCCSIGIRSRLLCFCKKDSSFDAWLLAVRVVNVVRVVNNENECSEEDRGSELPSLNERYW